MRIIAGKLKGTQLAAPQGLGTRPTSDRAREALFNLLEHGKYSQILRGARIVDVFAGTGALGLEAISRGAMDATFFENGTKALAILSVNIKKCKIDNICKIFKWDALNPHLANIPADILFFDPPYYHDFATKSLAAFTAQNWMAEDGLGIVQIHPKDSFEAPAGFEIIDDRKYGAARFLFIKAQK